MDLFFSTVVRGALAEKGGELVNWKMWSDGGTKKIIFQEVFDSTTNILKIFGLKNI